jgi:hypothetical protein
MASEWKRLLSWLDQGQNAAAIQAICAVAVAFFTVILIGLTAWYAILTRVMARTLVTQLRAAFQPNLEIKFGHHFQGTGSDGKGNTSESVFNFVTVENKGDSQIKLREVRMFIYVNSPRFYDREKIIDQSGLVLSPGKQKEYKVAIDVDEGTVSEGYRRVFVVHCTDLAGVSEHSFKLDADSKDVTHEFGFRQPLSRLDYYWLRLTGRGDFAFSPGEDL